MVKGSVPSRFTLLLIFIIAAHPQLSATLFQEGPRVYMVHSERDDTTAGYGDRIVLGVRDLPILLDVAEQNQKPLVLFLDGMRLKRLHPEVVDTVRQELRFTLRRTEESREAWDSILGKPTGFLKSVSVSVGLEEGYAIPTDVDNFKLIIIRPFRFWIFVGLVVVLIVLTFLWWDKSRILRDSGEVPDGKLPAFSLARVQMAFWLFIIAASYMFLWLITWEIQSMTESILILLGISSVTTAASRVIDTDPKVKKKAAMPSTGSMIDDVISDGTGPSIHRLQILIWTLLLGIVFVSSVYSNLAMPQFGASLLTLMGISSGTYVGLKSREE